jgi:hypothetical protein
MKGEGKLGFPTNPTRSCNTSFGYERSDEGPDEDDGKVEIGKGDEGNAGDEIVEEGNGDIELNLR